MNFLIEPHKEILVKLTQRQVQFILIGGYAVNFHGYNRTTGDMDIWLNPNDENKRHFLDYLIADGFDQLSIDQIRQLDFTKHAAFHIGEKPLQVEFLTRISGLTFEEAFDKKDILPLNDINIPFLHIDHLIISKLTSSRPKDKLDVEELQRILRMREENNE
ncbi:MAG: nucleotidyltransferase [Cyclobacteriaceae bacterium]|nr:nucleotidyltransferase [Cyclobacteriaceae bacterium]